MGPRLIGQNKDYQQHQLLNAVAQNLGADPGAPVAGQFWYRTDTQVLRLRLNASTIDLGSGGGGIANAYSSLTDGTNTATAVGGDIFKFRSANNILTTVVTNNDATHGDNLLLTVVEANITHNNLSGLLTGDPHTQYVSNATDRTITANHSFAPSSTRVPFTLGANAQGQTVTGLSSDQLDGLDSATVRPGNASRIVATTAADGKIDASFMAEKLASTDLSDVSAVVGTGSLVFQSYVDSAIEGRDNKQSVRLATAAALPTNTRTGNVLTASANGALTVDGVAVAVGNDILVKNEATGANNGIYTVTATGSGAAAFVLTRRADADTSADVTTGLTTFATEGTANANTGWTLITDDPITLNTTALVFTQTFGAGAFTGSNVTVGGVGVFDSTSGTILQFKGIAANSTKVAVTNDAANHNVLIDVTEANILLQNLGGTLTVAKGGTGAVDAPTARTNLGTVSKYTALIGDGAATSFTIARTTHLCSASRANFVQVQLESNGEVVEAGISIASNGDVTIEYAPAIATNGLRVIIVG